MATTLTAPQENPAIADADDDDENPIIYPRSKIGAIRYDFFRKCQDAAFAALERGEEDWYKHSLPIPMPAGCAYTWAEMHGKDSLLALGADLTLADEKYGEGWLEQFADDGLLDKLLGKGWSDAPVSKSKNTR